MLLRTSYWVGVILDTFVGLIMVFPDLFAWKEGLVGFVPGSDYLYAMCVGASLMFGWTVLLLWADRKPIERKGILLITVFPVVVGIFISRIYGLSSGFLNLTSSIADLVMSIILVILFLGSYFYSEYNSSDT